MASYPSRPAPNQGHAPSNVMALLLLCAFVLNFVLHPDEIDTSLRDQGPTVSVGSQGATYATRPPFRYLRMLVRVIAEYRKLSAVIEID